MQYQGELKGFPPEVVELMLQRQVEQGNTRDIEVFEEERNAGKENGGFTWIDTPEGRNFWNSIISEKDFNLFFEKYPKEQKTLETVNCYPKVMLVSDDGETWYKRVVFAFKNSYYLAWDVAETLEEAERYTVVNLWHFAKELQEPKIKLTKENLIKAFPSFRLEALEDCQEPHLLRRGGA